MKVKNPKFIQAYSWNSNWTHVQLEDGSWKKLDSVDLNHPRGGRRWNNYLWTEAFGGTCKLPMNYTELQVTVKTTDGLTMELILKPVAPKLKHGRSGMRHRVYVKCELCGREIPAGRIHQHTC